ncbi:hypothetical protein ACT453_28295, partial [Bacillus sp. D-CC]
MMKRRIDVIATKEAFHNLSPFKDVEGFFGCYNIDSSLHQQLSPLWKQKSNRMPNVSKLLLRNPY